MGHIYYLQKKTHEIIRVFLSPKTLSPSKNRNQNLHLLVIVGPRAVRQQTSNDEAPTSQLRYRLLHFRPEARSSGAWTVRNSLGVVRSSRASVVIPATTPVGKRAITRSSRRLLHPSLKMASIDARVVLATIGVARLAHCLTADRARFLLSRTSISVNLLRGAVL